MGERTTPQDYQKRIVELESKLEKIESLRSLSKSAGERESTQDLEARLNEFKTNDNLRTMYAQCIPMMEEILESRKNLAERDALLRDGIGLVTGVSYRSPAETIKSYNWLVKTKEVLGE